MLGITERSAFGILNDLVTAGYVIKEKDGRRNRYRVQHDLPLRETLSRKRSIGELLAILVDSDEAGVGSQAQARSDTSRS